jgi:predicted MFS family arabinose efflux permease
VSDVAIATTRSRSEGVLIATVAVACGVLVGNIYLSQTLIAPIARELGIDRAAAGLIVTLTQLGYALGLALVVPLADSLENKRLALVSACGALVALVGIALSQNPAMFLVASLLLGVASSGAQVLLPMVTHFVAPERQGRTIGLLMAGLLSGIMLARPFASFVAGAFGWRATFGIAAAITLALIVLLVVQLPQRQPALRTPYREIFRSMLHLLRTQPVLRTRAAYQAALLCAFNLFWTASPLVLAMHFGFDQRSIALFALAGAGGALAAPIAGRLADRGYGNIASLAAFVVLACTFLASAQIVIAGSVIGFALCGVVLDAAVQTNQVSGQRIIFALSTEARGRINAIYLTAIFFFGSAGPSIASWVYANDGWTGVAFAGSVIGVVLAASWLVDFARKRSANAAQRKR